MIGSIIFVVSVACSGCLALREQTLVETVAALEEKRAIFSQCLESMKLYIRRLNVVDDDDIWAVKMLDATSKIPVGLLSYNFGEMGHFKQCTEIHSKIDHVRGKYCLANIIINGTENQNQSGHLKNQVYLKHVVPKIAGGVHMVGYPTWAMCLPSNCSDKDAMHIMSISQPLGIGIQSITCQTIEDVDPPLNKDAIIGITILSLLILVVILSTAYDIYYKNNKKARSHAGYTAFSLYTNGKKLFEIPNRSSPLSCLDGIRVISMLWVIILHTYSIYTSGPVFNSKDVIMLTNSLLSMVFLNGDLACDTFLIVGGTLVTYVFFKKGKNKEINFSSVAKHYFHRYIRLTPPLAGVVLVSATLLKYMGSGPKWTYIVKYFQGFCTNYWWSSLLYIQNEVNVNQMCAGHTWYLDVDMQLYIFSPLIFWMLQKYTKTGIALLVFSILASILTAFFRAFEYQLSGIPSNYYSKTPSTVYMNDYYLKTETRAAPWLMGTILGYMLTIKQFRDIRVPKKVLIPMWILSLAVMLLCLLGGHSTLRGPEYYRLQNAFYIALVRPSFALAVGWMIWACATKHGGIINTILSLSIFQFLNKFIYSMYLLHVTSLYMIIFSQKTSVYITVFNLAYWFWGIFMFMFGLSIIWVLVFESPMLILEKVILQRLGLRPTQNVTKPANYQLMRRSTCDKKRHSVVINLPENKQEINFLTSLMCGDENHFIVEKPFEKNQGDAALGEKDNNLNFC